MPNTEHIREQIAEVILEVRQYLCNTEFAPGPFTAPVDPDKLKVEFPKQILNIKARCGGGKCPECGGKGGWDTRVDDPDPPTMCLNCGGTGEIVEEKSIGDIVKEWEDEQNKH